MTNKIEIKYPDLNKWKNAVQDMTTKTGFKIVENAVQVAPVDTGNYRSQITYDMANTVTANAKYSADIEYGTKPHVITATNAKALSFKQNGKNVVYKKVNHPGTRPQPVMRNAAKETQKQIPQIWQEAQRDNGL